MNFHLSWWILKILEDVVPRQRWMKDDDVTWSGGDRKGIGRSNLGILLKDRQCKLRVVRETVAALEKKYYIFCVCVCL